MPRKAEGRFGARVKCPCCHGNGRPHDPRRRQKRSKDIDCAAWSSCRRGDLVTRAHRNPMFTGKEGGGGGGGRRDPSGFILKGEEEENRSVYWCLIYRHEVRPRCDFKNHRKYKCALIQCAGFIRWDRKVKRIPPLRYQVRNKCSSSGLPLCACECARVFLSW